MRQPIGTALSLALAVLMLAPAPGAAAPEGQMTWAVHISLAPTWFDPAETSGIITPFMVLFALHDAMVKPLPGNPMAPGLAESWSVSPDGLVYEFVLRRGAKFHNGEPVTAEDVKFSFERYRGAAAKPLKDSVAAIETPDPGRVRFRLKRAWPDFMTFYVSATGASWIVPRKYVEKVGDEGFKKAPIGAGPYRFVSFTPGIELVVEAFEPYWRKAPSVKRIVLRSIPDEATRLAALKRGEVDVAYNIRGSLAEEIRRTPGLTLKPNVGQATFWVNFPDQWDPKSPWHDRRVRLAASHAIDRTTMNQADALGFSKITWSIIPSSFEFYWQPPGLAYDPARARQLLAEAGYANGFEAGDCTADIAFTGLVEAIVNDLNAVGMRARMRPVERAADQAAHRDKTHKALALQGSGAFGSAATRLDAFVTSTGSQSWIKDPEIDAWYAQQAKERDRQKRAVLLHQIQQKLYDEVRFIPIWELGGLHASGPRAAVSGVGLIPLFAWSGPYEDVQLKS